MKYFCVLVVLVGTALAQTQFYVDTVNGSDSNSGSQASPWKTIGKATSSLTPGAAGAAVNVLPGTYNECVVNNKIGTASQPIVFQATTPYGAKVTCNSSAGTTWTNGSGSVDTAYTTIKGFEITATGTTCYGILSWGSNNTVSDNYVHDIPSPGTSAGGPCGNPHGGAGIAIGSGGGAAGHDALMERNIVENIGGGASGTGCNNQHGLYASAPRFVIRNNVVSHACALGIHIYHNTTQGVVVDNLAIENGEGGIQNTADCSVTTNNNTTVSRNTLIHNGTYGEFPGVIGAIGENSGCTGSSNVYRDNVLYNNSPNTIQFPHGARTETGTTVPSTAQFNAMFVSYTGNAKTGNYNPASSSSVQVGKTISGGCASGGISPCLPTTDFVLATRSATTPTIGPYELSSGVASAQISPASLSFAPLNITPGGTSCTAVQTSTLSNTGTASFTVGTTTIAPSTDFQFGGTGTCGVGLVVAPAGSCVVSIKACPKTLGALSATVTVNSTASNAPQTIALTGTGTQPSRRVTPSTTPTLNFGAQLLNTPSGSQSITFQNIGTGPMTISSVAASGDYAIVGASNTCPISPATLASGSTCNLSATFTPTIVGTRSGSITFASDDPLSPQIASLTGIGQQAFIPPTGIIFQQGVVGIH